PIQPRGSRSPLFCVHPAGGIATCYVSLAHCLGTDQPFYGLQSRGLDGRSIPLTSIEEMAATYLDEIRSVQPTGPYQLAGWSMGAIVAYEIAQQLVQSGEKISVLAFLDGKLPTNPIDFFSHGWEEELEKDKEHLLNSVIRQFGIQPENIEEGNFVERAMSCLSEAKRLERIPSDIGFDQFKAFLHIYAVNKRPARAYHAKPYPGTITLLRSSLRDYTQSSEEGKPSANVRVFNLPETHDRFVEEPNAQTVASILAEQIKSGNNVPGD